MLGKASIHFARRALPLLAVALRVADRGHGVALLDHATPHVLAMSSVQGLSEVSAILVVALLGHSGRFVYAADRQSVV
jgi:hypothetical protein